MSEPSYRLEDLGDRRVLTVGGQDYPTTYSARVVRMLVERKGAARAPQYFTYRETRGRRFMDPLFAYLRRRGARDLRVLEVGCSFGHITECLADEPLVREIATFDTDPAFAAMVRVKVEELGLHRVRQVDLLSNEETQRLPYPDRAFDLVLVLGVVEHLPVRGRRRIVDEYYRVLAPGGHIAILDTPNRLFPLETHSVGLPLIQWLPPRAAFAYAKLGRPGRMRGVSYAEFTADGVGWRNASLRECLPSTGTAALEDVTEEAGFGWRFFQDTARSRVRRRLLPVFGLACGGLRRLGLSPSLALPYLNLLLRKRA
ncbi:MAG TPA: class I SAM-dependent methyltransferase [Candidatus Bathyarchaeia archaeon]|nr:class I SAM-dependent methyltransferase [Candidatus Bathyarchaeia archaeon]